MGCGGRRHIAGKQGDIRIPVADFFHLSDYAQAVAVGRIDIDHVNLGGQQGVDPSITIPPFHKYQRCVHTIVSE